MFKKKKSSFGDEGYKMKDEYQVNNLCVANLYRISSSVTPFGPETITTQQRYIFELVPTKDNIRYREIFTGFITDDESKASLFDMPYVTNVTPLTDYYPDLKDEKIPKLSTVLLLDEINFMKEDAKVKEK